VRLLFYSPGKSASISDIACGLSGWEINSANGDSCVFSRDASYFVKQGLTSSQSSITTSPPKNLSKSNSKSLQDIAQKDAKSPQRAGSLTNMGKISVLDSGTKKIILAEVIVGDEYYCNLESLSSGFPFEKHRDSAVTVRDQGWLWFLVDSIRAYPMYLIEWE